MKTALKWMQKVARNGALIISLAVASFAPTQVEAKTTHSSHRHHHRHQLDTNNSVHDLMVSLSLDPSFPSRKLIAEKQLLIHNYRGTLQQNADFIAAIKNKPLADRVIAQDKEKQVAEDQGDEHDSHYTATPAKAPASAAPSATPIPTATPSPTPATTPTPTPKPSPTASAAPTQMLVAATKSPSPTPDDSFAQLGEATRLGAYVPAKTATATPSPTATPETPAPEDENTSAKEVEKPQWIVITAIGILAIIFVGFTAYIVWFYYHRDDDEEQQIHDGAYDAIPQTESLWHRIKNGLTPKHIDGLEYDPTPEPAAAPVPEGKPIPIVPFSTRLRGLGLGLKMNGMQARALKVWGGLREIRLHLPIHRPAPSSIKKAEDIPAKQEESAAAVPAPPVDGTLETTAPVAPPPSVRMRAPLRQTTRRSASSVKRFGPPVEQAPAPGPKPAASTRTDRQKAESQELAFDTFVIEGGDTNFIDDVLDGVLTSEQRLKLEQNFNHPEHGQKFKKYLVRYDKRAKVLA